LGSLRAGHRFDVAVSDYLDSDSDPTNGATAVGAPTVYIIGTPANAFARFGDQQPPANGVGDQNWIVRAIGTNGSGKPIVLGGWLGPVSN